MQYVEDILENDLVTNLKYIYNKTDDNQTLLIFFIRCFIYYDSKKISDEQYVDFLLKELNLPRKIIYMNEEISLSRYSHNSIQNIMDNLIYRYLEIPYNDVIRGKTTGRELLLYHLAKYRDSAEKAFRCKKKKTINNYKYVYKNILLQNVYKDFCLQIQSYKIFDNFIYPNNHNNFELTFDELCGRYYDAYIQNEEKIIEKELEDYICANQIEDINIINRQIKIPSGIIDLLGVDKLGRNVLIELKVTSRPKDLLWQLIAYTDDLKKQYKELRTIVIAPKLDINILKQIPKEFEVYEFNKIKNSYKFKKIQ